MTTVVERDRFRQAILAALADKEMLRILDCAMYHPKSVNEVIREAGIPHSTAYRKIKWMLEEGLLFIDRIEITPDGKKFSLFRSTLKSINIKHEYGEMKVQVDYNINVLEKTTERLFSMDQD
jgi:predicted transcriptional regulator